MKSKESSKEDDIQAICELRGAGRNAPLALQLKAIDEEYHYLLDQGQSDKADYVQKLYAWKSKQATQVMHYWASFQLHVNNVCLSFYKICIHVGQHTDTCCLGLT